MRSARSRWPGLLLALLPGCAATEPAWRADAAATLAAARRDGRDLAVYFALPGRDLSDRMERLSLRDPAVLAALEQGAFRSLWFDGFTHHRLYGQWIGGGEGMGICVLDGEGRVYAARPGPQDPPELAAFLQLVAQRRPAVLAARRAAALRSDDAEAQYELAVLLLELGCRIETEQLLITAAQGGVMDAHHRLARLYALDGDVLRARQWLRTALPSPARACTEGYVLFKERRNEEAVVVLQDALDKGGLGADEGRARLYLGKALHQCGRDEEATAVLQALVKDAAGTVFGAAALHSLSHLQDKDHGHSH